MDLSSRSMKSLRNRLSVTLGHLLLVDKVLSESLRREGVNDSLTKHAIKRNNELAIQLNYTHLTEYLRSVLGEMYLHNPLLVVSKVSGSLQFHEIVSLGSFDAISARMIDHVFRTLESQRSTGVLIDKILDKTGVSLKGQILEDALYYLEVRHLIVHNSSLIDSKFEKRYGEKFQYAKAGNRLPISQGLAKKAILAIKRLCSNIDVSLIRQGHIPAIPATTSENAQPLKG